MWKGKIYLDLRIEEVTDPLSVPTHELVVRNVQCADLALTGTACNPYLVLSLQYGESRYDTKKSKIRMKTTRPKFDECFHFTVSVNTACVLVLQSTDMMIIDFRCHSSLCRF
jgi:Ras GTPase-activating protein 2